MTTVSYQKQTLILESLLEGLEAEDPNHEPEGSIYETAEAAIPAYYNQQLGEWIDAGCPEPLDYDIDARNFQEPQKIFDLIAMTLHALYLEFILEFLGDVETVAEAAAKVRRELKTREPEIVSVQTERKRELV